MHVWQGPEYASEAVVCSANRIWCSKSHLVIEISCLIYTQSAFTFSKLTIETLEQGVKYVQS